MGSPFKRLKPDFRFESRRLNPCCSPAPLFVAFNVPKTLSTAISLLL
jgi:hypothetical protein